MSILSLKLGNISSINCGSRSTPLCRFFSLLEDSFIISKHSVSLTEKEQYGGFGRIFTPKKERHRLYQGKNKFFDLLFRPAVDPSLSDEDLKKIINSDQAKESISIPFIEETIERIAFHQIKSIELRGPFLSSSRWINISFQKDWLVQNMTFVLCDFTTLGLLQECLPETRRVFNILKGKMKNIC